MLLSITFCRSSLRFAPFLLLCMCMVILFFNFTYLFDGSYLGNNKDLSLLLPLDEKVVASRDGGYEMRFCDTPMQNLSDEATLLRICTYPGLHGNLSTTALATIIVSPKAVQAPWTSSSSSSNEAFVRLQHVVYSWKRMPQISVVVASSHCDVLVMAREAGLPVYHLHSSSDVEDVTYRNLFQIVDTIAITPVIGYMNGDIIIDETVPRTIQAVLEQGKTNPKWKNFFMTGLRYNVDLPDELLRKPVTDENEWKLLMEYSQKNATPFIDAASDYFLINRGSGFAWRNLPPFLLGGVAFDNVFNNKMYRSRQPVFVTIDCSLTIRDYHINHARVSDELGVKESHNSLASEFNRAIHNTTQGKGRRFNSMMVWRSVYVDKQESKLNNNNNNNNNNNTNSIDYNSAKNFQNTMIRFELSPRPHRNITRNRPGLPSVPRERRGLPSVPRERLLKLQEKLNILKASREAMQ